MGLQDGGHAAQMFESKYLKNQEKFKKDLKPFR